MKILQLVFVLCFFVACKGIESKTEQSSDPKEPDDGDEVTLSCPDSYSLVPADTTLGVESFCVAKYEMKAALNDSTPVLDGNNSGVALDASLHIAVSRASGTPWVRISHTQALLECSSIGANYKLITLKQWNALARNIESNSLNWTGPVGSGGVLFKGHTDSGTDANAITNGLAFSPSLALAASTDDQAYIGTGNSETDGVGSGTEQIRTHILTNSQVVWDLSGNVRERVDADGLGGTVSYTGPSSANYYGVHSSEVQSMVSSAVTSNSVVLSLDMFLPSSTLTTDTNGGGLIYVLNGAQSAKVITRGGNFSSSNARGIFGGDMDNTASAQNSSGGFRCVYNFD